MYKRELRHKPNSMKNNTKIISLIVLVIILALIILFKYKKTEAPTTNVTNSLDNQKPGTSVPPAPVKISSDDIVIDSPVSGGVISSGTVHVSGRARGTWYFEASAPFEIQDNNKKVLATSHVNAQGDWMTTNIVPFTGDITFTVPQGVTSGFVVFKNDNPSGDPAKDKQVSVPVVFK